MKEKSKKTFKQYISKHRILFTIIIGLLGVVLIFLPLFLSKKPFLNEDFSGIEILEISSIIVTNIFLLFGALIAVWQYYISSSDKLFTTKSNRVAKAVKLAGYYKDSILTSFSIAKKVFQDVGIYDIMHSHIKSMQHFDTDELNAVFSKNEIEKIESAQKFNTCLDIICDINRNYDLKLFDKSIDLQQIDDEQKQKLCDRFWRGFISSILNNAEYFAMHFSHGIADDSVIYQSIYPTYLELCCIFYYNITNCRAPQKARLYSNVVWLFDKWKEESSEQMEIIIDKTRKASNMGTVMEKEPY